MNKLLQWAAICVFASGLTVTASAAEQGVAAEINTAHAHALMAKSSDKLDMVHTHLHHVLNCLVGPDGQGFDADAGNPCKGQGNGALPDTHDDSDTQKALNDALVHVQAGLKADALKSAQKHAGEAASALSRQNS